MPAELINGKINQSHLLKLQRIAKEYGYVDEKPILAWMKTLGSFSRGKNTEPDFLIDPESRVNDSFPINDRKQKDCIQIDGLDPKPKGDTAKFQKEILYFLIQVAKDGNTGNIDHKPIPRLTDFAYMVSYQPPTDYRQAMPWGVAIAMRYLAASFAAKQNKKVGLITMDTYRIAFVGSVWGAIARANKTSKL